MSGWLWLQNTHVYSEKTNILLLLMAATSSDLRTCPLPGSPSQNTFLVPENCGKGGDARELLRQEMPGAAWDNGREGGAGHTLVGTGWLMPFSRLWLLTWVWKRAHKQLMDNRPPLI